MGRNLTLWTWMAFGAAGVLGCSDKGGGGDTASDGGSGLVECEHGNSRADEVCDGFDNDCDDLVDEGLPQTTYYTDGDGDGFGVDSQEVESCSLPAGAAEAGGDCDDTDGAVAPDAPELCDDVDNDCDALVDDADGDLQDATVGYIDQDGDGYGGAAAFYVCELSAGYADNDDDCDDTDSTAGATITWYRDSDGDGYGADESTRSQCAQPDGYVRAGGDCDEADDAVNPAAVEVCRDGADNDCDGTANGCTSLDGYNYVSDADWSVTHGSSGASYLLSAADLDADGVNELVGASTFGGPYGYGHVFVYDKLVAGTTADDSGARYNIYGTGVTGGDYLGYAVAAIPDTDGDGYDEIVAEDSNGYVNLYDGPYGATMYDTDYDVQWADGPSASSGVAYMAGLDYDGDGRGDLAVANSGYSYAASASGLVWLLAKPQASGGRSFSSTYDSFVYGVGASAYFGYSIANGGDVDGDGFEDLVVGEYRNSTSASYGGAAYVFAGADLAGGALSSASYHTALYGSYASGSVGHDVATGGDFDGDGYDDLVTGAPYDATNGSTGAVYVVSGGSGGSYSTSGASHTVYTSGGQSYLGYRVDFAGDLDSDGMDELVIGHLGSSLVGTYGGAAAIFYGGAAAGIYKITTAEATILPTTSGGYLGADVAGLGDVSGDGIDDLAVGWYSYGYIFGFNGGSL